MKTFRNFLSGFGLLLISLNLFAENLHVFKYEKKFGYFNNNLEVEIQPIYSNATDFIDGYAIVQLLVGGNSREYRIINEKKETVVLDYSNFTYEGEGIFYSNWNNYAISLRTNSKVELHGNVYTSFYTKNWDYLGNGNFLIDKNGNEILGETKLISASFCSDGYILARHTPSRKFGYFDKAGKPAIPFGLDEANDFSDGFARAVLDGKDIVIRTIDRKYFFTQDLIERKNPELKNF